MNDRSNLSDMPSPSTTPHIEQRARRTRRGVMGRIPSLRIYLGVGFGLLLAVMLWAGVSQWRSTDTFGAAVQQLVASDVESETLLLNIDRDGYQAQLALEEMASAPDDASAAEFFETYATNRDQTLSRWDTYRSVARGVGDEFDRWPSYLEVRTAWAEHSDELAQQMLDGARNTDPEIVESLEISRQLHDDYRTVLDGIVEELYVPLHASYLEDIDQQIEDEHRNVIVTITIALAATVLVGSWLSWLILRPIRRLRDTARPVSSGEINVENLDLGRADELGELADCFDDVTDVLGRVGTSAQAIAAGQVKEDSGATAIPGELGAAFTSMWQSIRTMVLELEEKATELSTAAGELNTLSTSMRGSAERTSSLASNASASGEQVSASVGSVVESLTEIDGSLRNVAASANEASTVASNAVVVAKKTTASIEKLGESSEEIGNVIKVINSIAEQTNLLALNATIEAARAGEAGKGFAVVANEVKELANQTAKATEEISTRIETIQNDTTGAVEANLQIGETIDRINDISAAIAAAVEEQSQTTARISQNFDDAAKGTAAIADNVGEVAAAADETRTSTSDTMQSAQELAGMAASLRELVENYR